MLDDEIIKKFIYINNQDKYTEIQPLIKMLLQIVLIEEIQKMI